MKRKIRAAHVLALLAALSFLAAMLEGYFYYAPYAGTPVFRFLLMLQNAIKAFGFRASISLDDIMEKTAWNTSVFQAVVTYTYAAAVFMAPFCTLSFFYKILSKLLHLRAAAKRGEQLPRILVFGYNENVRTLLNSAPAVKSCIHLISEQALPEAEEMALLKKGIVIHRYDCLALKERELLELLRLAEAPLVKTIILLEHSSAKNFSLFCALRKYSGKFAAGAKCYCSCEDDGIYTLLEDLYDNSDDGRATGRELRDLDLEIFSLPELQVRAMFDEHSLHAYYQNSALPWRERNVHLLIVGFGKVGQQILLQAMNLGVVHGENQILIDVVDYQIDYRRGIFANCFSDEYVEMTKERFCIRSPGADGKLEIRFHEMDVRDQAFRKMLSDLAGPGFTYAAVCIQDMEVGVHCAMEIQRFLTRREKERAGAAPVCLRMDADLRMAGYLSENSGTLKNVFAMKGVQDILSFPYLMGEERDREAKRFDLCYAGIRTVCRSEADAAAPGQGAPAPADHWNTLRLFQRDANRALCAHAAIKAQTADPSIIRKFLGPEGALLRPKDGCWSFDGTEEELARRLHDIPEIREWLRMEHRRWCYFMAARGWSWGEKKDAVFRRDPCMTDWETLFTKNREMCKYDLLPFLVLYEQRGAEKESGVLP